MRSQASAVGYRDYTIPDSALNTVVFGWLNTLYERSFPRILHTLDGLKTHAKGLVETVWHQLPPFAQQSLQIAYTDFSKLFVAYSLLWCANNLYNAHESQMPVMLSYFFSSVLVFFQYALLLMAWLQKPQTWIHSSILLLKLPNEWQQLPKTESQKLDISCCVSCNKLREIKGDIRSLVLYCFQQLVLSGMRILPLGSVIAFVPYILMTGRMLAEYRYRTEGVCDRHIEKTYQQNWEFFAVLGLCHFFGVTVSNAIGGFVLNIPADAIEPCVSGLMMLAIVRLTYGMKNFPRPVENAYRSFPIPDPTRYVVESGIDFLAFKFKQKLRDAHSAITLLENSQQQALRLRHFFSVLKTQYQKQINTHYFFSKVPLHSWLPEMFWGSDSFFKDPIVGPWCLNQINNWKNALTTLLHYRALMLDVCEKLKPLAPVNRFRHGLLVRIPLFFFGGFLSAINDIFTMDFVLNRGPSYIQDLNEWIPIWCQWGLVDESWSCKTLETTRKLEANLNVVKRILNEFPRSSSEEFFNLLKDDRFRQYVRQIVNYLQSILVDQEYGFELINEPSLEEITAACEFPAEETVSLNAGRLPPAVPSLPRDNGMQDWDDSDARLDGESAAPALAADEEWDDSDCRLDRRV